MEEESVTDSLAGQHVSTEMRRMIRPDHLCDRVER